MMVLLSWEKDQASPSNTLPMAASKVLAGQKGSLS